MMGINAMRQTIPALQPRSMRRLGPQQEIIENPGMWLKKWRKIPEIHGSSQRGGS
jgi:hypothetical protein